MAHKKGVGSTDNGRDSNPKYLGVKLFGSQYAKAGNIIVRQRGTKYHPGENVYMGRDHTLHAKIEGTVSFTKRRGGKTFVHIIPLDSDGGAAVKSPKARKTEAKPKAKVSATVAAASTAASATAVAANAGKPDKLTKIEGVGPKIAEHLNAAGITTFAGLAATSTDKLQEILTAAGPRFKMHSPATWPQQAQLAADGKWDELEKLQDALDGGRVVNNSEEE